MATNLATKLRPENLEDIIGQEALTNNKTGIIFKMLKEKYLPSIIFHGGPGIGKTSLALVIVSQLHLQHVIFNAAIDNKQKLATLLSKAEITENFVLIVEEIHRMNQDRQDILLKYIEQGTITLIATTTENPYFVINRALRSRCLLIRLKPLSEKTIFASTKKVIKNKLNNLIQITDEAISLIAQQANGDFRYVLNIIGIIVNLFPATELIGVEQTQQIATEAQQMNFKTGEDHHNLKSALQKSIRGSDVDAAIYYLARMLATGDYESLLRRLSIIAYEDIGIANPALCARAMTAISAFRQIGMPEGMIPLSVTVIELALSEKTNSALEAINNAYSDVIKGKVYSVPDHLKNSTGKHLYLYPHNYPHSYVNQEYLPKELKNQKYYFPKGYSIYEKKIINLYENFKNKKK